MNNRFRKAFQVLLFLTFFTSITIILISKPARSSEKMAPPLSDTIIKVIHDTIFIHDTVYTSQVSYVDTTPIVINKKRAFLYIKDTFNIEDRTYYITEKGDTVKTFYFDYTYYIFKYHFQDTLVRIDSVLGCDLYTHSICDDRDRIVVFHTCEGESRMIINMLNEKDE